MPADLIGTNVMLETAERVRRFEFQRGPIFANLLLADEINRATPKTQSALLEAMQERSVTVAGTTHLLAPPFFVLATQNPLEMEGTYPLPEAQLDRFFFKLLVKFPTAEEMETILDRTTEAVEPRAQTVFDGRESSSYPGWRGGSRSPTTCDGMGSQWFWPAIPRTPWRAKKRVGSCGMVPAREGAGDHTRGQDPRDS